MQRTCCVSIGSPEAEAAAGVAGCGAAAAAAACALCFVAAAAAGALAVFCFFADADIGCESHAVYGGSLCRVCACLRCIKERKKKSEAVCEPRTDNKHNQQDIHKWSL